MAPQPIPPVIPVAPQPVPVPISPQPVIGAFQMSATCGTATLYVNATAHATGHPSINDVRLDFSYPGSINTRGFDMGSGEDTHVSDSAPGMPVGSYTVDLLLVVFDSNGQEATRSASFPVACVAG